MNVRLTFHLDGSGIYYDPWEPLHLDSILAWDLAPRQGLPDCSSPDDVPDVVQLPLLRTHLNGAWVWNASALFPVGPTGEDLQYLRKRFDTARAELTSGSPNLAGTIYRERNIPVPLLLCRSMVAYAAGDRRAMKKILKRIRYLGKYRNVGYGKILSVDLDPIEEDFSLVKDGRAMRHLPMPSGSRMVRPIPPYWNRHGRVRCCQVGEAL